MTTAINNLDQYRKFLLNRHTTTTTCLSFIEDLICHDDESAKHSYHKIMVHNWVNSLEELFDTLMDYCGTQFVPVKYTTDGKFSFFYTENLSVVMKIMKTDFMIPFRRNMYNIDILFNDKTSEELFQQHSTMEYIISGIVSRRFTQDCELDLSAFSKDAEFTEKNINFYKITLLEKYKILMLRMGHDTKILNLSKNDFSQVPLDILNYFIKGDLIGINLSYNNIPSLSELLRVSSKIEKLWLEGNPLCDDVDATLYVKLVTVKFPRLKELDGIPVNEHGMIYPFWRNYMTCTTRAMKMLTEKFITLYFSHYDSYPRSKIDMFYAEKAKLSIATNFTDIEEQKLKHYFTSSRNIVHPTKRRFVMFGNKLYTSRKAIAEVLMAVPETLHDPSSFTVDVLKQDNKTAMIVVDGIYKEKFSAIRNDTKIFQFRRTFIFEFNSTYGSYFIINEMFYVTNASKESVENGFKKSFRNLNSLALVDPKIEEIKAIISAFAHITQLKKQQCKMRLRMHNWDIRKTLVEFTSDLKNSQIPENCFADKYLSDLSSDDEID